MADLKRDVPETKVVHVDAETLAAIDRGAKEADEGRTTPIEEVHNLIPEWISRFESQTRR